MKCSARVEELAFIRNTVHVIIIGVKAGMDARRSQKGVKSSPDLLQNQGRRSRDGEWEITASE